jgi:cation diffusion facilitator CzcD-associated flavoprotein CzcO
MHTLGFVFEPWRHEKSIADGPSILDYLNRIADERHIRERIRFDRKVVSADWHSADGLWQVVLEDNAGQRSTVLANWLYLGSGYYDYDEPHDAAFAGRESFGGQIVHPQFWPQDLDFSGKQVVVIGSGATAVTIVPAMAREGAGHVTMLQRTPTWYATRPARDAIANTLRKILPDRLAYRITRWKNVFLQDYFFKMARNKPEKVKQALTKRLRKALGDHYDPVAFTPPYNPWDQRLCLVPDEDLFAAIRQGKASVVTDHIERFDETGIQLKSGRHLDADVIVTATGLRIASMGKIAISVDGDPVNFADRFWYKGCMFSNLPNLAAVFGYLNASWTLRADIDSEFVCKLINHMDAIGAEVATPYLAPDHALEEEDLFDFSSGYIQRGKHLMPRNAVALPWRLNQDYRQDKRDLESAPIEDGILRFSTTQGHVALMEAAE